MSTNPLKIALLDTNALVALFTFWEACEVAQLSLSAVPSWQFLRQNLATVTTSFVSVFKADDFQPIQDGIRCFKRLDESKSNFDYLCCYVSRSELHHVLLSATASEQLHRHRVPVSLARKRPLIVHQLALPSDAYSNVENQIVEFFDTMRNSHSIDIKVVEDPSTGHPMTSEEIFGTAMKIWSHVLMETMDAYIFAAAIEADADYLITSDSAFRKTINGLRDGHEEWRDVASALKAALRVNRSPSLPRGVGLDSPLT